MALNRSRISIQRIGGLGLGLGLGFGIEAGWQSNDSTALGLQGCRVLGLGVWKYADYASEFKVQGLDGHIHTIAEGLLTESSKKTTSVRPLFAQMQWTQLDACALPEDWARSRGGLQQRFEDTPSPAGTSIFGAGLFGAGNLPLAAQGGVKGLVSFFGCCG